MNYLIVYEYMENGLPRYTYTIMKAKSVMEAIKLFKVRDPQYKILSARIILQGEDIYI